MVGARVVEGGREPEIHLLRVRAVEPPTVARRARTRCEREKARFDASAWNPPPNTSRRRDAVAAPALASPLVDSGNNIPARGHSSLTAFRSRKLEFG